MEQSKYHPLVDCDTEGTEQVPMFCSTDANVISNHHKLYLEEIIDGYYRLIASNRHSKNQALAYSIHCPSCGAIMKTLSLPLNEHKLCLYTCSKCVRDNNNN